jgi:hypothetical protein
MSLRRILYLDQNAWIALAKAAKDPVAYPAEHAALTCVIEASQAGRILVPLSFANIYETAKINVPARRAHLAGVQSKISGGKVFRGRRRILEETLLRHIGSRFSVKVAPLPADWFLSDLWFESVADYTPEQYGFEVTQRVLDIMRQDPAFELFDFLAGGDDAARLAAVRQFSAGSAALIARLEARRQLAAGEPFALRRRAYSARLLIDEIDFVFKIAKRLGLPWTGISDIGASLAKSLVAEVRVLNVERELVVRLEDQKRELTENDLRDMDSFTTALPLADIFVAEKPFVNLARQARLGEKYDTMLLTSITELSTEVLQPASEASAERNDQ